MRLLILFAERCLIPAGFPLRLGRLYPVSAAVGSLAREVYILLGDDNTRPKLRISEGRTCAVYYFVASIKQGP